MSVITVTKSFIPRLKEEKCRDISNSNHKLYLVVCSIYAMSNNCRHKLKVFILFVNCFSTII